MKKENRVIKLKKKNENPDIPDELKRKWNYLDSDEINQKKNANAIGNSTWRIRNG